MDNAQADFFIEQHIRAKGLAKDTLILGQENRDFYGIITQNNEQIDYLANILTIKDTIISKDKVSYLDIYEKYSKQQKKIRIYKNTTIIFASITAILILIATLVIK